MALRSKRLRKKLHVDEFQEFGFTIDTVTVDGIDEMSLLCRFIDEAIEANSLLYGGRLLTGFVTLADPGSPNKKHQENISFWLKNQREVIDFKIGPLIDAWNGY